MRFQKIFWWHTNRRGLIEPAHLWAALPFCDLKQADVIYFAFSKYGLNSFTTLFSRYLYEADKTDDYGKTSMSTYHLIHDITPSDGSWKLCSTRDLAAFSGLTTIRRILHAGWSVLLIFTCRLLKTFWSIQATTLSIHGESRYRTKLCWTLKQLHLFPINRCFLPRSLSFTFSASGNLLFGTKPLKFFIF